MISCRPADLDADMPALVRLLSLTELEPPSVERVRERWARLAGTPRLTTVALADDGEAVGVVDVGPTPWTRPGLFRLTLVVEPSWRRQGIGSQLLGEALRFARAQGARWLEGSVRDNAPWALSFGERRGFRVDRHIYESALDLGSFDESAFAGALERAAAAGYRFFSLADLGSLTEARQRRLYDLNRETGLDNPANNGFFVPFGEFRREVLEATWFRPDGQILAADGECWVGLAGVGLFPEAGYAYNGFTGVRRAHRGRGVAQALKLLAIRWARQQGASSIRTSNDSRNAPMLAINRKLGYRPEPGLYYLVVLHGDYDDYGPPKAASSSMSTSL